MHHLSKEPKRSTVIASKVEEAIREIDGREPAVQRPWERAIVERQRQVRDAYAQIERDLRGARNDVSRKAADQLAGFLNSLPTMETERDKLKRQIAVVMETSRSSEYEQARQAAKSGRGVPNGRSNRPEDEREK